MVKIIDLSGPEGNAYYLLLLVGTYGRQLNYSSEKITEIRQDMKSGDYDHLVSVFHKHFKSIVELIRNGEVVV
jgi:hypothetical protein